MHKGACAFLWKTAVWRWFGGGLAENACRNMNFDFAVCEAAKVTLSPVADTTPPARKCCSVGDINAQVCPFAVNRSRFGLRYSRVRGRRQSKFLASSSTGGARNFYPSIRSEAPSFIVARAAKPPVFGVKRQTQNVFAAKRRKHSCLRYTGEPRFAFNCRSARRQELRPPAAGGPNPARCFTFVKHRAAFPQGEGLRCVGVGVSARKKSGFRPTFALYFVVRSLYNILYTILFHGTHLCFLRSSSRRKLP